MGFQKTLVKPIALCAFMFLLVAISLLFAQQPAFADESQESGELYPAADPVKDFGTYEGEPISSVPIEANVIANAVTNLSLDGVMLTLDQDYTLANVIPSIDIRLTDTHLFTLGEGTHFYTALLGDLSTVNLTLTVALPLRHTVYFEDLNGETIDTQLIPQGWAPVAPKAPDVPGKRFIGWILDEKLFTPEEVNETIMHSGNPNTALNFNFVAAYEDVLPSTALPETGNQSILFLAAGALGLGTCAIVVLGMRRRYSR